MSDKEKEPLNVNGIDKATILNQAKETFENNVKPGELSNLIKPISTDNRPIWEIDPDFINPYEEVAPLQCWAKIGDRNAIPKEGLITFSAKQKKGKSLSTYALSIPLLSGEDFDTLHPLDRPNMIMVFDMEMGNTTLHNRTLSQIKTIGKNGINFVVCNLKGKSKEDMRATITTKVELYKPDIVVIDQAAKLVDNGNDLAESNVITNFLDTLSIGRSVWVVMHENKGKEDDNMKGHLGSFLSYAAVEAYGVDRKDGIFSVTLKEARESDPDNASQFRFALNSDNGQIIDAERLSKAVEDKEKQKLTQTIKNIFGDNEELRSGEIQSLWKSNGERNVRKLFEKARDLDIIRKNGDGKNDPYVFVANAD